VVYCVEGGIWFTLPDEGDRTIELEPGDRLDLPAGVRHGAIVGMDGVTCLEGHRAV
jgi:quercetin dioxygenase-like cupin family protein